MKDIVGFVSKYLTCRQVKAKHQGQVGLSQNIERYLSENRSTYP